MAGRAALSAVVSPREEETASEVARVAQATTVWVTAAMGVLAEGLAVDAAMGAVEMDAGWAAAVDAEADAEAGSMAVVEAVASGGVGAVASTGRGVEAVGMPGTGFRRAARERQCRTTRLCRH